MKTLVYGAAAAWVLLASGCGKSGNEGGNELRAALKENVRIMETFSETMDKAKNAEQVTEALNQYTRAIEKLTPKFQALLENHPELNAITTEATYPEGLEDFEDKFAEAGKKMMQAMMKAMQYGSDPDVQKAQNRMLEASRKLAPESSAR